MAGIGRDRSDVAAANGREAAQFASGRTRPVTATRISSKQTFSGATQRFSSVCQNWLLPLKSKASGHDGSWFASTRNVAPPEKRRQST